MSTASASSFLPSADAAPASSRRSKSKLTFDLTKTTMVSEEALCNFMSSPLSDDLTSVPGIGEATAQKLKDAGMLTTTQLVGAFLTYKRPEFTVQQHCDAFYRSLRSAGVTTTAASITLSIAEKANKMIPGIFDAAQVDMHVRGT